MTRPTRYAAGGSDHDVVVIGGGAAGLSAALVLGRAGRCAVVLDAGHPRNVTSPQSHGVFTRDGAPPAELLRLARTQLAPYPSVDVRQVQAVSAERTPEGFVVRGADGTEVRGRRILLAVGVRDELPPIPGLAALWGTGVLHCPFCHGWEVRDEPLAIYARGRKALDMATLLLGWSRDLLLCADGPADLSAEQRDQLVAHGVGIVETPLTGLGGAECDVRLESPTGRSNGAMPCSSARGNGFRASCPTCWVANAPSRASFGSTPSIGPRCRGSTPQVTRAPRSIRS